MSVRLMLTLLLVGYLASGCRGGGVEVTLDEGRGFFLGGEGGGSAPRFAPIGGPAALRARLGPFSARRAVGPPLANETEEGGGEAWARLVTPEVRRDRPVLSVLFAGDGRQQAEGGVKGGSSCFVLYVHRKEEHLMASCRPAGADGACLAQATLPAAWWPPLEPTGAPAKGATKPYKAWVRVHYAVLQGVSLECSDDLPVRVRGGLPGTPLGRALLSPGHGSYEEVGPGGGGGAVRLLVPQGPHYPGAKVYVPVRLRPHPHHPPYVFVIRARVKSGLRILGAQVAEGSGWSISVESNPRQTVATVTAFVKDTTTAPPAPPDAAAASGGGGGVVFTWLFEADEGAAAEGGGRIWWQLRYVLDSSLAERVDFDEDKSPAMTSRLDVRKDEVKAVVPLPKSSQLLNTAVLNGRQVSLPMKVFVVSEAGKVGDVTLQASCHSADESILKVSPSCSSVYVDGSEVRGSQNASVLVQYGAASGEAHFRVWMPEMPLDVRLSDSRLSQLKGWRTPRPQKGKPMANLLSSRTSASLKNDRWIDTEAEEGETVCRLRHQQARVEVVTRFLSVDHNSGRESYLLGRRAEVRVTDLVAPFLRVADARIARLHRQTTVRGLQSGRTEVQVLSPITGRVSGAREVRVGSDKETVTHLEASVVTGLDLAVTPDDELPGVYVAHATASHKLLAQYQEGLLDIRLHFSDGTWSSLSDVDEDDFRLSVDTFDSTVVAFAPVAGLRHPRVVAVGRGRGDLLHVTLELADLCQKRRSQPLAMAYAFVDVDFASGAGGKDATEAVKGSGGGARGGKKRTDVKVDPSGAPVGGGGAGGEDAFVGGGDVLYRDAIGGHRGRSPHHEPAVQARQNVVRPAELTPLEIGMYALLGVFCLAILVFLVSCSVFAVRYRRKQVPPLERTAPMGGSSGTDPVAHAHDWVWLGRATLERNAVNTRCSQTLLPMADFNGNHRTTDTGTATTKVQRREKGGGRPLGSGCRGSNLSFPGSEISIRITTNPQELTEEELALADRKPPTPPPSHTVTRENKRVRIVTHPVAPPLPPDPLRLFPAHPPPPVPPHRRGPCAPPRHPRAAALSEAEWESVAQGMDYDQLIEYFENLKESNA